MVPPRDTSVGLIRPKPLITDQSGVGERHRCRARPKPLITDQSGGGERHRCRAESSAGSAKLEEQGAVHLRGLGARALRVAFRLLELRSPEIHKIWGVDFRSHPQLMGVPPPLPCPRCAGCQPSPRTTHALPLGPRCAGCQPSPRTSHATPTVESCRMSNDPNN